MSNGGLLLAGEGPDLPVFRADTCPVPGSGVVVLGVRLHLVVGEAFFYNLLLANSVPERLWPTALCSCRKLEYWTRAALSSLAQYSVPGLRNSFMAHH